MLTEKSTDADLPCKMVGFAAQRLMAGMIGIDCATTRFAVDYSIPFTSHA
jgi:hypothetical protein